MAYGETNGHMTDDVTWPWKVIVTSDPQYAYTAQCLENSLRMLFSNAASADLA